MVNAHGTIPEFGRFGHSAVIYKKTQMYIFGGEKSFNAQRKSRDCLNDVRKFDGQSKMWSVIRTTSTGFPIDQRRNHAACMCGKHMVVFGGISGTGNYLNDVWELNLKTRQWRVLYVKKSGKGLAFHAMCAVFSSQRRTNQIAIFKALPKQLKEDLPKEGLFVFGGQYDDGTATNQLKYLNISMEQLSWKKVNTQGVPPKPRYAHTMNYFDPIKSLIVYGGRDNHSMSNIPFYADIGVLNMLNMNWIGVCTYGEKIEARCSHMAYLHGSKLVLFGGINQKGFVKGDISYLEMDQKRIQSILFDAEEEKVLETKEQSEMSDKDEFREKKVRIGGQKQDQLANKLKEQMQKA